MGLDCPLPYRGMTFGEGSSSTSCGKAMGLNCQRRHQTFMRHVHKVIEEKFAEKITSSVSTFKADMKRYIIQQETATIFFFSIIFI